EDLEHLPTSTPEEARAAYGEIVGLVCALNYALSENDVPDARLGQTTSSDLPADSAVVFKLDVPDVADIPGEHRRFDVIVPRDALNTMFSLRMGIPFRRTGAALPSLKHLTVAELLERLGDWIAKLHEKLLEIARKVGFQSCSITV